MPKFLVQKGNDALVYFERVVEAESAEQANEFADADKYADGWKACGHHVVYDSCDVIEENTEELAEEVEESEDHIMLHLTVAERNIIIAALRLWQRTSVVPAEITDIASDHTEEGHFLDDDAIDYLIEGKINV